MVVLWGLRVAKTHFPPLQNIPYLLRNPYGNAGLTGYPAWGRVGHGGKELGGWNMGVQGV